MTENLNYPKILLHKGKERSLLNYHPWVFSGAVKSQPAGIEDGALVDVCSFDDRYLGTGYFHKGTITVRLISFTPGKINADFWLEKINKAYEYRKLLNLTGNNATNAYRLIHAEGDGLPGLIIDIYNSTAVIQAHTAGIAKDVVIIAETLQKIYNGRLTAIYNKSAETLKKQNITGASDGFLMGSSGPAVISENNFRFNIDFIEGQKTGFFLDQRENRNLLMNYSKGKKVLNTFCYSGGFSVYALGAGASYVHSVDSSRKAIAETFSNVSLNFPDAAHEGTAIDVFDFLRNNNETYDVVILDPPAFAKHLSAVQQAIIGYRKLNHEAISAMPPGGILFTFSCSQAISSELFRKVVFQAAAQAKRNVRIMHQLHQPADHPVNIYHPEGEYLKGLVLYIE